MGSRNAPTGNGIPVKRNMRMIKVTKFDVQPDQIDDARRWLANNLDREILSPINLVSGGKLTIIESLRVACNRGVISRIDPNPTDDILEALYDRTVGLGILEQWLADPKIEQINIKGPYQIELQVDGIWQLVEDREAMFKDGAELRAIASNIVRNTGRELNRHTMPYLNLRFEVPTVLRIHMSQLLRGNGGDGLAMFIRRGRTEPFSKDFLLERGTFNEEVYAVLADAAKRLIGAVFLGPVGSGKTVLLEKYIDELPNVPIVVVDDAGDCMPSHPMCGTFQLPEREFGSDSGVSLGDMTKEALREGDVLIVAEVRGSEEAGILISDAPSMRCTATTAHGDSAETGLSRLVSIAQRPPSPYAGTNSADALRTDLANAFPLVIQVDRRGQRRFVRGIYHNRGWNRAESRWNLHPIVDADIAPDGSITWNIDTDFSLDSIKSFIGLDLMQVGRTQAYDLKSPAAMMNMAVTAMNNGEWLSALYTLSQMESTEDVRQKTLAVLERLPDEEAAYQKQAQAVVKALGDLERNKEWGKAINLLSETNKRTPVVAIVYKIMPALRQAIPNYTKGASEVKEAHRIIKMSKELIASSLPWRELEKVIGNLESLSVEYLPPNLKQAVGQTAVDLCVATFKRCDDPAQQNFFKQKLVGLVGFDRATALVTEG